jgi:hypothetical protein
MNFAASAHVIVGKRTENLWSTEPTGEHPLHTISSLKGFHDAARIKLHVAAMYGIDIYDVCWKPNASTRLREAFRRHTTM